MGFGDIIMPIKEQLVKETLALQPGDIIVYELPYEDAQRGDFFPFETPDNFEPMHTAMWVGGDRPVAHAVREGYLFPGLRLTRLSSARCVVFRRTENQEDIARSAEIMKRWALSSKFYSREDYDGSYPERYWEGRHEKDVTNFFSKGTERVAGPATIYPEPRASEDKDTADFARDRDKELLPMRSEGIRRAVKFASRRDLVSPHHISKGQRCTAMLVAVIQAGILAPIVKTHETKEPFKQYKGREFLEFADEVLVEDWQETELGGKLLACAESGNYEVLFGPAFAIDQRYAFPKDFYKGLKADESIKCVGHFAYFEGELSVYNASTYTTETFTCSEGVSLTSCLLSYVSRQSPS
jgi:hypothetical protein